MPYANLPCTICGAPGNARCVSLRTGRPIKNFHQGGRVVTVKALRPAELKQSLYEIEKSLRGKP